jgi:hypothetical protein
MNGSAADKSTPRGARSDSKDATPPMSVGEERAALRASVDAEEVTRSSIVTDLLRSACASARRALSPTALLVRGGGERFRSVTVLRLCVDFMCFRDVVYHVLSVAAETIANACPCAKSSAGMLQSVRPN